MVKTAVVFSFLHFLQTAMAMLLLGIPLDIMLTMVKTAVHIVKR